MHWQRCGWGLGLWLCLAGVQGCSLSEARKGESCIRSSQCADGLACVMGKCSSNIQSIADMSMNADLGLPDAAVPDAATDAGPDAALGGGAGASGGGGTSGSSAGSGAGGTSGGGGGGAGMDAAASGNDAG
jgi:hypothetical protein